MGEKVKIRGRYLSCPVCENQTFAESRVLLNTAGMSFLGFDWLNKEAVAFSCDQCGYMYWFHPDFFEKVPSEEEKKLAEEISRARERVSGTMYI